MGNNYVAKNSNKKEEYWLNMEHLLKVTIQGWLVGIATISITIDLVWFPWKMKLLINNNHK